MSQSQDIFKSACDLAHQAIAADEKKNYEMALKLYERSLTYFVHVIRYEKNQQTRETISMKANEYMERAEELKKIVDDDRQNRLDAGGAAVAKPGAGQSEDHDAETKKLQGALAGAVLGDKPDVSWNDVAGLEAAKDALQETVITPVKHPQLFTGQRKPWRGILLYGPPGTGKSYLAKAVATEADSTFFSISSSDLVSKWQGESERLVRNLFEMARQRKPSIVFIDEVDSLCSSRSEGENDASRRIKTEFLVQMQGVGKNDDGILVLGATNTPWEIDAAMRRRFEKRIYIPLPDTGARVHMFKLHIADTPHSLTEDDFRHLGELTDGYSGSDISVLVRQALFEPIRKCRRAKYFKVDSEGFYVCVDLDPPCAHCQPDLRSKPAPHGTPCFNCQCMRLDMNEVPAGKLRVPDVTKVDFESVMAKSKPTVSRSELKRFEEWTEEFGEEGS